MSLEENKVIASRLTYEGLNKKDVDGMDDYIADDYVFNGAPPDLHPGLKGLKQFFIMMFEAFPDWNSYVEDMVAEGDKVAVRWGATGTHKGEWEGIPPTGKKVEWKGLLIYRIVEGKLAEEWVFDNTVSIIQELKEAAASQD